MLRFGDKICGTFCIALYVSTTLMFSTNAAADEAAKKVSTIDGSVIYRKLCANCHGENGQPTAVTNLFDPAPGDLFRGEYKYGDSYDEISRSISEGFGKNMLRFRDRLSKEQIAAVTKYIMDLRTTVAGDSAP